MTLTFSNLIEMANIKVGKETNYCLSFSLVLAIIWIPINISVVIRMQEGNKSLDMLKMCNLDGNFYIFTVVKEVGKRPVSRWFGFGRKRIYREKNEAIRIVLKHNNTLETRDSEMWVLVQTTTFLPRLWHANAADEN